MGNGVFMIIDFVENTVTLSINSANQTLKRFTMTRTNGHFSIDLPLKPESSLNKVRRIIDDPEIGMFVIGLVGGLVGLGKFGFEFLSNQDPSPIYLFGGMALLFFAHAIRPKRQSLQKVR